MEFLILDQDGGWISEVWPGIIYRRGINEDDHDGYMKMVFSHR